MIDRPDPSGRDPFWKRATITAIALVIGLAAHYAPGLTGIVRLFGSAAAFLAIVLAFLPHKPRHGWFYPVTVLTVAAVVILSELILASGP